MTEFKPLTVPETEEEVANELRTLQSLKKRIEDFQNSFGKLEESEGQLNALTSVFGESFVGKNMKSAAGKVEKLKAIVQDFSPEDSLDNIGTEFETKRKTLVADASSLYETVKADIAIRESNLDWHRRVQAKKKLQEEFEAESLKSRKTFIIVASGALVFIICIFVVLWRDTGFKNMAPASVTNTVPTPIPLVFDGLAKEFSDDSVGTKLKYKRVSLSGTISDWSSVSSHATLFITVLEGKRKYHVKCEMKGDGDETISRLMKGVQTQISGALDRVDSHGKKNTVVIKDCTFAQ